MWSQELDSAILMSALKLQILYSSLLPPSLEVHWQFFDSTQLLPNEAMSFAVIALHCRRAFETANLFELVIPGHTSIFR